MHIANNGHATTCRDEICKEDLVLILLIVYFVGSEVVVAEVSFARCWSFVCYGPKCLFARGRNVFCWGLKCLFQKGPKCPNPVTTLVIALLHDAWFPCIFMHYLPIHCPNPSTMCMYGTNSGNERPLVSVVVTTPPDRDDTFIYGLLIMILCQGVEP